MVCLEKHPLIFKKILLSYKFPKGKPVFKALPFVCVITLFFCMSGNVETVDFLSGYDILNNNESIFVEPSDDLIFCVRPIYGRREEKE